MHIALHRRVLLVLLERNWEKEKGQPSLSCYVCRYVECFCDSQSLREHSNRLNEIAFDLQNWLAACVAGEIDDYACSRGGDIGSGGGEGWRYEPFSALPYDRSRSSGRFQQSGVHKSDKMWG